MDLNELEKLEKAATSGPWKWRKFGTEMLLCADHGPRFILISGGHTRNERGVLDPMTGKEPVSALIAELRNAAPALIRIARAAKEYVEYEIECDSRGAYKYWREMNEALKELEK